jgi:hypothetical protein
VAVVNRPTYYVVPCGGHKLDRPAPARDLYTSSSFRLALAAAETDAEFSGGTVLVLSALHGLVALDTVLAPYDTKMGDTGSVTPATVTAQALALGIDWGADVYAFLPARYFDVLDEALRDLYVYPADVYEATAGIGEHRHVCAVVRDSEYPDDLLVDNEAAA